MTRWLLFLVVLLALVLILQATTRSAIAAWASVTALAIVLVVRYEFWPGAEHRQDDENED
jgi:hypothetical protein